MRQLFSIEFNGDRWYDMDYSVGKILNLRNVSENKYFFKPKNSFLVKVFIPTY